METKIFLKTSFHVESIPGRAFLCFCFLKEVRVHLEQQKTRIFSFALILQHNLALKNCFFFRTQNFLKIWMGTFQRWLVHSYGRSETFRKPLENNASKINCVKSSKYSLFYKSSCQKVVKQNGGSWKIYHSSWISL